MPTTHDETVPPESASTLIISRHNPKVKQFRALLKRAQRERTQLALIEGLRLVTEALRFPNLVRQIIVAPELLKNQHGRELVHAYAKQGIVVSVSAEVFASFSQKDGPQGIAAVIVQHWNTLNQIRLARDDCWVTLLATQDPGNLGTILRSCDAVGCRGVILLDHTTDPYDPTALRASMGATFSQRLVKTSFRAFAEWKAMHGYTVIGTSDAASLHYREIAYPSPTILLMGSERQGLLPEQQALCDHMVSIPMNGSCDSLNVAIATAVVLYEILDQRTNLTKR